MSLTRLGWMAATLAPAVVLVIGWSPIGGSGGTPPAGAATAQEAPNTPTAPSTATSGPTPTTPPPLVEQRPLPGQTAPRDPVGKEDGLNNMLPRPNSGHEPEYQGDRGTGSQFAVLGAMLMALGLIGGLVYRQSRRSSRRWSAAAPMDRERGSDPTK